jgi:hypothetical protein
VQDTTQLFVNTIKLRWDRNFTVVNVVASCEGEETEVFDITKNDVVEDEDLGLYACRKLQEKGWRGPTLVIWR